MRFDFFTFGGSIFWEDVFFYQKWRIQRHCFTRKYRLLDSWDIRRARGSFEACQKAFIKFIECYEITKQPDRMVVLLHGYGDGKNIFKPLWRKLILTNSTVAALNYPSLFHSSLSSAHQLLFFLNHSTDISEVSFVTRGAGNLVLQQLLNLPEESQTFKNKMRVRNIVEINPIVKENLICEFLEPDFEKIDDYSWAPLVYYFILYEYISGSVSQASYDSISEELDISNNTIQTLQAELEMKNQTINSIQSVYENFYIGGALNGNT